MPGALFCVECGEGLRDAPPATGPTERLTFADDPLSRRLNDRSGWPIMQPTEAARCRVVIYEGDERRIAIDIADPPTEERPILGYLHGQAVYEYDPDIWCDVAFAPMSICLPGDLH